MLVGLYTVRMVLSILGTEDYGIYNVVAGMVVFFTFLNGAMTSSIQRFLNFALGQKDTEHARNVYSVSFTIYVLIAILIVVLSQTVGLWFFHTQLNIPAERQQAAFAVYQFSVVALIIGILQIPYRATIVAYEKMSFFAMLSIVEALFKLANVVILKFTTFDKLMVYAFFICIAETVIFFIYKLYCNRAFVIARFRYCKDRELFRQLLAFSGWSFFGSLASLGRDQGAHILVNIYFGVGINAAMGIASQVGAGVYSCLINFLSASDPQIIKSYSVKDYEYFMQLIFWITRLSFCLLLLFVLPLLINLEFVLKIWLNNVPEYTAAFTRLILLSSLISAIAGPLSTSIRATGDIKRYQLILSCFVLACLPLSLIFLWMGFGPLWIIVINTGLDALSVLWFIFFLRGRINLHVVTFFCKVIVPMFIIAGISTVITIFLGSFFVGWGRLIATSIISTINITCLMYVIGLNKQETVLVKNWIKCRVARNR